MMPGPEVAPEPGRPPVRAEGQEEPIPEGLWVESSLSSAALSPPGAQNGRHGRGGGGGATCINQRAVLAKPSEMSSAARLWCRELPSGELAPPCLPEGPLRPRDPGEHNPRPRPGAYAQSAPPAPRATSVPEGGRHVLEPCLPAAGLGCLFPPLCPIPPPL